MTDKERMDLLYRAFIDGKMSLASEKSRLDNATIDYLYAVTRYTKAVEDYFNSILELFDDSNN